MRRLSLARDAKIDQPDGPRPSILVAGMVCATGKTTLARTIEHLYSEANQHLQPATVSFGRSTLKSAEFTSSIGWMGRSDGFSLDADANSADDDSWTLFGNCLARGGHLVDLEGHLLHDALQWAERVKPRALLEEVSPLSIVIPVGTSRKSIDSIEHTLDQLKRIEPIFMQIRSSSHSTAAIGTGFMTWSVFKSSVTL